MNDRNTRELQKELTSAPDLSIFLSDHPEQFSNCDFSELLNELFQKSGLTKATLAKRAGTSDVYLYRSFPEVVCRPEIESSACASVCPLRWRTLRRF